MLIAPSFIFCSLFTTYAYDCVGNLISTTDALGNTEKYAYDANGNIEALTDPDGNTVRYERDSVGQVTAIKSKSGAVYTSEYDAAGNLISETDPNGATTYYEYDAGGLVIKITDALENTEEIRYNSLGNVIKADGASYTYDKAGRITSAVDESGIETRYAYDKAGNLASVTANGKTAGFEYDLNGNILAVNSADGQSVSFEYDILGNLTAITYPDGTQDGYTYDALGQLISEQSHDGIETKYSYDPLGNVSAVTEEGETTTYAYDELSRPVSVTYSDGSTEYTEYDKLGNIVKQTDTNGDVTSYGYTVENMVSRVTFADGDALHYGYDKAGNLVRETTAEGVTSYSYDLLGHLTEIKSANGTVTEYKYNADGEVISELVRSIVYSDEENTENHYSNLAYTSSEPFVATAIRNVEDAFDSSKGRSFAKPTPKRPTPQAQDYAKARRQATTPTQEEYQQLLRLGYTGGYGQYANDKQRSNFPSPAEYMYNKQQGRPNYQNFGPVEVVRYQNGETNYRISYVNSTSTVESPNLQQEYYCNSGKYGRGIFNFEGENYPIYAPSYNIGIFDGGWEEVASINTNFKIKVDLSKILTSSLESVNGSAVYAGSYQVSSGVVTNHTGLGVSAGIQLVNGVVQSIESTYITAYLQEKDGERRVVLVADSNLARGIWQNFADGVPRFFFGMNKSVIAEMSTANLYESLTGKKSNLFQEHDLLVTVDPKHKDNLGIAYLWYDGDTLMGTPIVFDDDRITVGVYNFWCTKFTESTDVHINTDSYVIKGYTIAADKKDEE